MKNLIVFLLPVILFVSTATASAQGKSKEAKVNKGQVNSTVKRATNPGNSSILSNIDGKNDKDNKQGKSGKKDKGDKKDKDTQLEKSLKKEGKKVIKDVLK